MLPDQSGEVDPLDDGLDQDRRPGVEEHLEPPAQGDLLGPPGTGRLLQDRRGVQAPRQQRGPPQQPGHGCRDPVCGAHRARIRERFGPFDLVMLDFKLIKHRADRHPREPQGHVEGALGVG